MTELVSGGAGIWISTYYLTPYSLLHHDNLLFSREYITFLIMSILIPLTSIDLFFSQTVRQQKEERSGEFLCLATDFTLPQSPNVQIFF